MAFASNPAFRPTEIVRFVRSRDTAAGTLIVETDAGLGYLKALGNPDGPHALVKELIGTHLAALIGLPTFDYAIVNVEPIDELPFFRAGSAQPGPAFVTRSEHGVTWSDDPRLLDQIDNPEAISGLVAVDTWLRNTDRYFPPHNRVNWDNVFFSSESGVGLLSLRAMDFSHCVRYGGELTKRVLSIGEIKDPSVFGLFPDFRKRIKRDAVRQFASTIRAVSRTQIADAVALVPGEWYLSRDVRDALIDFLVRRAEYVAETIESNLFGAEQLRLDLPDGGDE